MTRKHISITRRLAIRKKGPCDICGQPIAPDEGFDVSHRIPLAMGGADDDSNMFPVHRKCHRVETSTKDIPAIAKAKRVEARHLGAAPPAGNIARRPTEPAPAQKRASRPMTKTCAGMPALQRRFTNVCQ